MAITSSILNVFCMLGMALTIYSHWQCNWRVAWTSLLMYAGRRQTLWATIATIFSRMTRDVSVFVKCDTIFSCLKKNNPQFHTSNFRKVVWQHTEDTVGSIVWVLPEIYLAFQQWKNLENPLRIDEVIAMSLVYYFFGTQCRFWFFCLDIHLLLITSKLLLIYYYEIWPHGQGLESKITSLIW